MSQATTADPDTAARPAPRRAAVEPLASTKTPLGPGAITLVGVLLALLVLGLGVIGLQVALVATGLLHGTPWLTSGLQRVDGLTPAGWMSPAGLVLVLLGVALLVLTLKRRPRKAVALNATTGVFLRPRDLARLATAAAEQVDGIQQAQASAARSGRITLSITTTTATQDATGDVARAAQAAVEQRLSALARPARISVRTKAGPR